ncbi:hypothetical protein L2E82_44625 [Cichorium intybus]|uniref:Uncharacterized protein n=1 Tax=Cichorium intybus TaxID=13427 RepID=A0ACB8ZPS5_CICIN|nr:hypothetical protein L2E82_44625 [Cichorium intybus]
MDCDINAAQELISSGKIATKELLQSLRIACDKFGSLLVFYEELVVEKAATSGTTEENTLNSNADPQASLQGQLQELLKIIH